MQTSERTDYQAFPRAMAIAETAWTQNANKDWKNFCERMVTEFERLKVSTRMRKSGIQRTAANRPKCPSYMKSLSFLKVIST